MADNQDVMDTEVKVYVVKAAAQRMNEFMAKPNSLTRLVQHPAVKTYLKGTPEGKTIRRMVQRLIDRGSIAGSHDVGGHTFLGKRLREERKIDWDECRRVLLTAFVEEELERLASDGQVERVTLDDGVTEIEP